MADGDLVQVLVQETPQVFLLRREQPEAESVEGGDVAIGSATHWPS